MDRFRVLAICAALAATPRLLPAAGDAAKGKAIFEQCGVCHNADSEEKKMGPGLKGLFKRDKMANGKKPTEATVKAKIDAKKPAKDDKKEKTPPKMSPQERAAIARAIVHLRTKSVEAYQDAAAVLREYLIRDPHNADLRYRLAHALDRAGKKGEAEETARAALEIDEKIGEDRLPVRFVGGKEPRLTPDAHQQGDRDTNGRDGPSEPVPGSSHVSPSPRQSFGPMQNSHLRPFRNSRPAATAGDAGPSSPSSLTASTSSFGPALRT